jgi:hypothetical protein
LTRELQQLQQLQQEEGRLLQQMFKNRLQQAIQVHWSS